MRGSGGPGHGNLTAATWGDSDEKLNPLDNLRVKEYDPLQ